MTILESSLLIALVIILVAFDARRIAKQRTKIKERVNFEYDKEIKPTIDELENRLGETELMYEDLEQNHWVSIGTLSAIIMHLIWHTWYLSIGGGILIVYIGHKFLSLRPFTTSIVDR